jgi:long-chain acyl-CoA synthetase
VPTYDPTMIDRRPRSMAHLFLDRVEQTPDAVAYYFPVDDVWQSATWAETHRLVLSLAAGLIAVGVRPEDRVAIMSSTRYEWILADLAIMCAGGATTTVYPTSMDSDVAHILKDSETRVVIVEDGEQIEKLWRIRSQIPQVVKVVLMDGTHTDPRVMTLEDLLVTGENHLVEDPAAVDYRLSGVRREDLGTLMYTSGTTGTPKGVRLKHSAWTYEGAAIAAQGILGPDDLQYLWLPLAHSFGKVLLSTQLACGFPTAIDGRVDKIIDNLAVIRPTFMGAAPRIFEKAHGRIMAMTEEEGGLKKKVFDQAFAVARRVRRYETEGRRVPFLLGRRYRVLDKLVFAKIRDRFGGRLRFFISGAAALNKDIAEFFDLAGITILEGYGLTESSAGSFVNLPHDNRLGTVGQAFPGTDVQIAPDGEILLSGPGVMDGYHNLPEETAAVLRYGWLHTGDIGELDANGHLRITDRKKDFFKTAGGKYVAPTYLEGAFKALCPYASQVVVVGDARPFCVAIVALDPEGIEQWAAHRGLTYPSYAEIVASPEVHDLVSGYVDRLNATVNRWETIKRFVVADEDLSVEAGELTPSLKVKRPVVEARYADRIDALFPRLAVLDRSLDGLSDAELSGHLAG